MALKTLIRATYSQKVQVINIQYND